MLSGPKGYLPDLRMFLAPEIGVKEGDAGGTFRICECGRLALEKAYRGRRPPPDRRETNWSTSELYLPDSSNKGKSWRLLERYAARSSTGREPPRLMTRTRLPRTSSIHR